jgi:hypothetical protein
VAPTQDDGAAQVSDNGDDMAITAFPTLAPRLRSVTYPDNFKPNIQKYDGCSDPNIWLSTYYVAVKAAGGNFDHMAAYFSLVCWSYLIPVRSAVPQANDSALSSLQAPEPSL